MSDDEIVEQYQAGVPIKLIPACNKRIYGALERQGLKPQRKPHLDGISAILVKLYLAGKPAIGHRNTLNSALKRRGIERRPSKGLAAVVGGAILLALLPAAAGAQDTTVAAIPCFARGEVERQLTTAYGEQAAAMGVTNSGHLMRVWLNPGTGSWTVTVTTPDGTTCIGSGGIGFELATPKPEGQAS